MSWSKMVDLELDDDDQLDAIMPFPMANKPKFPFGTKICLCGPELRKLDLDPADCKLGDTIDLRCFGEITSIDQNRVEIQLQRMAVENEMTETGGD